MTDKTKAEDAPIVWEAEPEPGELNVDDSVFDSWDEVAEAQAIAEGHEAIEVKTILINRGTSVAGRFPDGSKVYCPLTFSVADLDAVTAEYDNEVDQLKELLKRMGDEKTAKALEYKNLISVTNFAERFFTYFMKVAETPAGK